MLPVRSSSHAREIAATMERKLNDSPGRARGQASARRCSESSRVSSGPARRRFPDHPPVCLAVTRPVAFGELPLPDRESRLMRYAPGRSEEHTSELQSLMRISYAVFCLKKKT